MANLPLTAQWHPDIYQIEIDDPVEGGPNGIDNRQGKELGENALFMKAQMDAAIGGNIAGQDGFSLKMLDGKADQVDSTGRDLLKVLGVTTIQAAMTALTARCNGTGVPNFSGLMIGDYINGIDLSAIPAENGGDAGQAWNATYKNNQIVLSGFNTFKHSGDTEVTRNHILFTFRNIPLRKRMNPTNDNTGGYHASELRAFLDGTNGNGTGDYAGGGVTTGAFLTALKQQLGAGNILPIRKLFSNKVEWTWQTYSLWLPTENEVLGDSAWGQPDYGDGIKVQFPIYQKSTVYRVKRRNGLRDWWWEGTPYAASSAYFAGISYYGVTAYITASGVGGCAPAFCAA